MPHLGGCRPAAWALLRTTSEFWDTYDVTDYLDGLHPECVGISGMTVRLDPADREALGRIASERGVGPSTLVRMCIHEVLRGEGP